MNQKLAKAMNYEKRDGTFGNDADMRSAGCGHDRYLCLLCKRMVCEAMLELHRQRCKNPVIPPRY